jgi:hypothetical protein
MALAAFHSSYCSAWRSADRFGGRLFAARAGLVGLCPGPPLVDLGFFDAKAALFVLAMASGMRAANFLIAHIRPARVAADDS